MALDRTWYNSLVDDDGSGMVGSVWDKADVDSLMDAVDSEISRLDVTRDNNGTWQAHNPGIFPSAGTISGANQYAQFVKNHKQVTLAWKLEAFVLSVACTYVGIGLPFQCSADAVNWGIVCQLYVGTIGQSYCVGEMNSNRLQLIFYPPNATLPAGFPAGTPIYLRGQMSYKID